MRPPTPAGRRARPALTLTALACILLAGCQSLPPGDGFDPVRQLAQARAGGQAASGWQRTSAQTDEARAQATRLLAETLDADRATAVALLNNRHLQAAYAELGIAGAELLRAGRPPNPQLSLSRLSGGGSLEIDRSLMVDLMGWLTLPVAAQAQQQHLQQVQTDAARQTLATGFAARRAFFDAVAAQQMADYQVQVRQAAQAAADLARRMRDAGNFSPLEQMREQAFEADAAAQLARARLQVTATREALARALGVDDPATLRLPDRLPDLPATPRQGPAAEQQAVDQRLDVIAARQQLDATAWSLGLTRSTRLVNVLDAGWQDKRGNGQATTRGPEVVLELPLFDFGASRIAGAQARYEQALHQAAATATDARSQVREAHAAYLTHHQLARHYRDEVVPLRQRISRETLLRYNGMLSSVFELLADAREQIAGVTGAVQSLHDFWRADTDLQSAIAGDGRTAP